MISASLDAWLRLSSIQPKTRIVIRYRRRRDTNGDHAPGCSSGQTAGGSHSSSSEAVQAAPGGREPVLGATVFRLAQTVPDGTRALVQAGGSPFDVARRRPTYRIRMACKRSGVRIPIAPPRSEFIIRNPEPRLRRLAGQPSAARQTGRTSIQVQSAHRSGRAPSDGSRLRNASFTDRLAGMPRWAGLLICHWADDHGQGGRASNRAGYIR
jgi:hypothetical protein